MLTPKDPRSHGEYQDWEYPDQQDIEDLAAIRFDQDSSTSQGPAVHILLKIVGAVMLVGFIGSILFPVIESIGGAGNGNQPTLNQTSQELQAYEKWIFGTVNAATLESGSKIQTEFLGVQFDNSIEDPIVGILAVGLDRHIEVEPRDLQRHSIMILERLFMDDRAESVTLAWLRPNTGKEGTEYEREVILLLSMLRSTAQGINWPNLRAEELQEIVDYYHEPLQTSKVSFSRLS